MTKAEVRAVAARHQLPTTAKPESMEICFVPDGDYARFVEKVAGPQPKGEVVTQAGEVLGEHDGIHRYTVGQRRGLNVAQGERLYVQRIDADTKQVVVGSAEQAQRTRFSLLRSRWVRGEPPTGAVTVKVRHRHLGASGTVSAGDAGRMLVELDTPVMAVTPGQAAVCYDGDRVLGGGWIA
jgi:tRNA-specific 2-thiouridylase